MSTSPKSLAVLIAVFSIFQCVNAYAIGVDWPQYRGPDATGRLSSENLDIANGKLKIHWKVPSQLGFSSFAVAGNTAVTVECRSKQDVCVALDAASGKELWSQTLGPADYINGSGNAGAMGNKGGDGPRSTPAISGDKVYVYDAYMKLHCLNRETGEKFWMRDVKAEYSGKDIKWHNASSPLVDETAVYVAGGGPGHSFLAFEKNSGELKWKNGSEKLTHATPAFAEINDQKQIVFFAQFGLVAVSIETGKELWRTEFPFSVSTAASPVVNGNRVYCSAGYGVGAGMFEISADQKVSPVWRKQNRLINHWSSPVLSGSHLFGLYEFKRYGKAPLQCVEFSTGEIKWQQSGFGPGNCVVIGDKVVALSDAGELAIVSATPEKYNELWRGNVLEGKCWTTPAFSDGKIYIRSTKEAACISFE